MLATASDEFRRCLADLDVGQALLIWRHVFPNMPQPTRRDALAVMHIARTTANSIHDRLRFYSHRWCLDHGYPSQLPDHLKPRAERMYPQIAESVGISVNSKYPVVREAIHGAMREAVLDCYANGDTAPAIVKPRMQEARERERRGLMLPRASEP